MPKSNPNLWNEFNLRENNPDRGGGILYALRYDLETLKLKREQVITAITNMEVGIEEYEIDQVIVTASDLNETDQCKLLVLAEELSTCNDAIWYAVEDHVSPMDIDSYFGTIQSAYYSSLYSRNPNLAEIFESVEFVIPRILGEIAIADTQNSVLTSKQRKALNRMAEWTKKQADQLNNPRIVTIGHC